MISTAIGTGLIVPPNILPPTIQPVDPDIAMMLLPYIAVASIVALLGWILAAVIRMKFGGKLQTPNIIIPPVLSIALSLRFGFGIELVQGVILCLILLYAANSDIRTREVADGISIMIAITALIGAEFADIPMMFLTAVLITIPQLLIAVLKQNCYGGADIKLMAACAFLLGIWKGFFAIIIGLLLAVICTLIIRKVQKKNAKESFALIPYLAVGSMLTFFI